MYTCAINNYILSTNVPGGSYGLAFIICHDRICRHIDIVLMRFS